MARLYKFNETEFTISNLDSNYEIEKINWSRNGDKDKSSFHSISPYLAMFPPALPKYFIKKYTKENDLICDPFSGRGTTALKSRELKRKFIGSDLNPYALVLSRAKIGVATKNELLSFVNSLEQKFNSWIKFRKNANKYLKIEFQELKIYYSAKNLKQLIFLREAIGKNWKNFNDIENMTFGITLGLMHGKIRKDGTSKYFSLDMPNTISMSPNYVAKFSKERKLTKPKNNIFTQIKNAINKKYDNLLSKHFNGNIFEQDALKVNNQIKNNSIDLVVTSPPYLSIVNYTSSNWLKLWLLGYDRKSLKNKIKLSDHLKFDEYLVFITTFLNNIYPKVKKLGYVALVVGDVHNKKLIESIWEKIQFKVKFKLENVYHDDSYLQNKKTTNMLNERKGKATLIEKVIVLRK